MSEKMLTRLAVTCGGTGGHFYPGLSVARTFASRPGCEAVLILSGKNAESQGKIASEYGIKAVVLPVMPSPSLKRPRSLMKFGHGLWFGRQEAIKTLKEFKPQALLAMGSFAGIPVILAAKKLRTKLFLHDGNAWIGKANRFFSGSAEVLMTAFEVANANTAKCPLKVTGMPLRPELLEDGLSRDTALKELNERFNGCLVTDKRTILIFGGSQGARMVNEAFAQAALKLSKDFQNFQIIHLTGQGEYERCCKLWEEAGFPVLLLPQLSDMRLAYQVGDAVIARSGGSSIAEMLYFGKSALLIPYPYAAEDHQMRNAEFALSSGGAKLLKDRECPQQAYNELKRILECTEAELREDGAKLATLARPKASDELLDLISEKLFK